MFTARAHAEDTGTNTSETNTGRPPLPPPKPGMGVLNTVREKFENAKTDVKEHLASSTLPKPPKPGRMGTSTGMEDRMMPRPFASTTPGNHPVLKERFEEQQKNMQGRMQERQTMLRNQLAKKGEEQYTKVVKRLSAAVLRLDDIADRIGSRITKLSGDGIDVHTAQSLLTTAQTAIAQADAKVKAIPEPTFPATTDASTTPQMINDALKSTRDAASSAEEAIRAAQKALMAVVVEIKHKGGAQADEDGDEHASTTPQN